MSATEAPRDGAAFCADLVRTHDFVRYASTLFLPGPERRALLAIYAFNIEVSRVHEQVSQPLPGEMRLQWWTDMLAGAGHGGVEGNPVAAELLYAIRNHRLPVSPFSQLVEEHQFDLYNDPMPTMAALDGYLGDTRGALFALAARIVVGAVADIDHLVHHAGLAQGILHLIASLPRDAARRQLFIPLDLLARHGLGQEQVFAAKATPVIRAMLAELRGQARQHLDHTLELAREAPGGVRPALLPLALVSRDLVRAERRIDADPFQPQLRSRLATLWTLWRAARSPAFRER